MCRSSATGTRTRVARVRAEYPNQLDYSGDAIMIPSPFLLDTTRDTGRHFEMTCSRTGCSVYIIY